MMPALNPYKSAAEKSDYRQVSSEREELVIKYLPLVKNISNKIGMRLPNHIDVEDLHSAGILGLIDAVDKFNPERGVPFEAYADFRIRGAIFDELRLMDRTPRSVRMMSKRVEETYSKLEAQLGRMPVDEEMAEAMSVSLDDYNKILLQINSVVTLSLQQLVGNLLGVRNKELLDSLIDDKGLDPMESLEVEELKTALARAIDDLPEKHRLVLSLYYYEDLNMKEIGKVLNVTESRVSQIHAKCMIVLRKKIRILKLS
jgi:RNA polymerase sigma factor for flagellar operon FliA